MGHAVFVGGDGRVRNNDGMAERAHRISVSIHRL